jgi:mannose-1-phosphate guanylyltransferase/mannose-6-phosphate isomerase
LFLNISLEKHKEMIQIVPIILCGGSGTRLWPLSRSGFPKQFLALAGKESLFQQTLIRAAKIANTTIQSQQAIIVTNEEHRYP